MPASTAAKYAEGITIHMLMIPHFPLHVKEELLWTMIDQAIMP